MRIQRFFADRSCIDGDVVTLAGDEFLHMKTVLRYKVGYKAIVCANDGVELECTVAEIGRDSALLHVDNAVTVDAKRHELTLYAGLLKNNKLDFTIQKAVELGVDRVIPFTSENCAESKFSLERAQRIALEAAKQCGSAYLSEIGELTALDDILDDLKQYDDVLFAYECERRNPICSSAKEGSRVALIVGPEGGFTPEEAQKIAAHGARTVTLGRRILRAETAAVVGCALLLNSLGELDYGDKGEI